MAASAQANGVTSKTLPVLAFLGPQGTYTHQAASNHFGSKVKYQAFESIAAAFHSVGASTTLALIPIENSLHGAVIETLDLLRSPDVGKTVHIREQFAFTINHSLIVRRGTSMSDVKTVLSHEQALGQCAGYIRRNLPNARLIKTASTAAATQDVLNDDLGSSAAICSRMCADLDTRLSILEENIQDASVNLTRFILLSSSKDGPIPISPSTSTSSAPSRHAMIRFTPRLLFDLDLVAILGVTKPFNLTRIDRRPSLQAIPFHDTYFLTLESTNDSDDLLAVVQRLRVVMGGDTTVLGEW